MEKSISTHQTCPFKERQAIKPVGANQASINSKKQKYALTLTGIDVYSKSVEGFTNAPDAVETHHTASAVNSGIAQKRQTEAALPGISLCKKYWYSNLHNFTDSEIVQKVLHCIEHGYPVGIDKEIPVIQSDNWPSADKFRPEIQKFLAERLSEGSIEKVPECEVSFHSVSPLGAFEKGLERKLRVIHDLSFPGELSINSYLDKSEYSVTYSTVRDAVKICQTFDTPWLAKTDLKNAYFSCPIKNQDKKFLGFSFKNDLGSTKIFRWAALPYGLRPAAYWFDLTANCLKKMYVQNGAAESTLYYLDDIITITGNKSSCQSSLSIILETCEKAGFKISTSKTVGPARVITFLGIQIDTVNQVLSMSQEKMSEIRSELLAWKEKSYCSKRDLLAIVGKMNFCSQMIKNGKKFMRRLIELSTKGKSLNSKLKLTKQAKADVNWWVECMQKYNGIEWFPKDIDMRTAILTFSDASNIALAGICENNWTIIPYTGEYLWLSKKSIQYRELYAAVLTIATFAYKMRNKQVVMHIDNQSMQLSIQSGTSKVPELMGLIRSLYYYTTINNIHYHCIHIGTRMNAESDSLSRLRLTEFFLLSPQASRNMSRPARILRDF